MSKIQSKKIAGKFTGSKKDKYKITNWSEYNKSLCRRGSLEIWIDEEIIKDWFYTGPSQRGGQFEYADKSIVCLLQLKSVFKLGYRQLEGFTNSLIRLMGLAKELKYPSYSQICRRAVSLEVDLRVPATGDPMYLIMDSTGLKVYGEGEWKVKKHGVGKHRTWRKLHLVVDEKSNIIHGAELTENGKGGGDAQQVRKVLEKVEGEVDRFSGDGAYDTRRVWQELKGRGIKGIIPPQSNAVFWKDKDGNLLDHPRNDILKEIEQKGREEWKKESGYHRRSISETAMMRFKTIMGSMLYSRIFQKQKVEAAIKVTCLNKMTGIGMPISVKINPV